MKPLFMKGRRFLVSNRIQILLILFVACDFLNQNNDFEPTGDPFTLNPNITLVKIQESRTRFNPSGAFSLDFICNSKSNNTETAILPAGLFFISQNKKVQNTIIVKDYQISVSSAVDTFTIGTFSVNEFKALPGDSDFYSTGPVTDNPDLQRIIDIVRNKNLNPSNVMTVQHAIYQVTSGDSLSPAMLDSLTHLDTIPALLVEAIPH
jgi:hypothetical protein